MAEEKKIDAVICLGCVIQGETPHFDYICQAVAYGITQAGLKTRKPVIFGVLTTLNQQQALIGPEEIWEQRRRSRPNRH